MFGHTCDRDRFAEFLPQLFASFNYYSYLCPIKIKDMEDKRYPTIDEELREALARIDATRNDQNRWGTFSEMMSDFRKEHSEWFR